MSSTNDDETRIRRDVKRSFRARSGFRWHLRVYVLVTALLLVINLMTTPALLWSVFPIAGWGVGVALHGYFISQGGQRDAEIEAEVQRRLAAQKS